MIKHILYQTEQTTVRYNTYKLQGVPSQLTKFKKIKYKYENKLLYADKYDWKFIEYDEGLQEWKVFYKSSATVRYTYVLNNTIDSYEKISKHPFFYFD